MLSFSSLSACRKRRGFTLLEVLVSVAILAGTLVSLLHFFPYSFRINKGSANRTTAAYLAQAGMETALSRTYSELATGITEPKARLATSTQSYLYAFQRQTDIAYVNGNLQVSATDTGMKRVNVTVYWQDPFNPTEQSYVLTTLVSDR